MSFSRTVLTDRTGLLTTVGGLAVGLDHPAVAAVLVLRLLIPILLILHAGRGATPTERIALVRGYLCLTGTCAGPPSVSRDRHGRTGRTSTGTPGPSESSGRRDDEEE